MVGASAPHPWEGCADPGAKRTKPEGERDYEHECLTHKPILLERGFRDDWANYDEYVKAGGYEGLLICTKSFTTIWR